MMSFDGYGLLVILGLMVLFGLAYFDSDDGGNA